MAAQVEQLITNGSYKAGDRLPPERVLAEELGVSRGSTREAFRLLEARGLVTISHGIGAFVADADSATKKQAAALMALDEATVPEFFEVRIALECEAAALAAKRIRPPDVEALEQLVADLLEDGLTDEQFVERDFALHRGVVQAAKNQLLLRLFDSMVDLFTTYSIRVLQLPGRREQANAGHAAIVKAIVGKRSQAARKEMTKHLTMVEDEIIDFLEQLERGHE
ncbi:MAG: FadR/GntR family transcriptional regulator [Gaiellaceae bacterium]